MFSETIELRGHIIDSLTLPKVLDQIVTRGATFNIVEFKIGQKRVDPSLARIEISAPSQAELGAEFATLVRSIMRRVASIGPVSINTGSVPTTTCATMRALLRRSSSSAFWKCCKSGRGLARP